MPAIPLPETLMPGLFKLAAAVLVALLVHYGLDFRRKAGAGYFVAPRWQVLMKVCVVALLGGSAAVIGSAREISAWDWAGLIFAATGTMFVVAAKRALGSAYTFAGQYLNRPRLVTHGIYAYTRNPLYFGVFQCQLGALLIVTHQLPTLLAESYLYWLAAFTGVFAFAGLFNWSMAGREARYLEDVFGEEYRRYRARVPFLVPFIKAQ